MTFKNLFPRVITIAIFCLLFRGAATAQSLSYTLTVSSEQFQSVSKAVLNIKGVKDSANFENGKFHFSGTMPAPVTGTVFIDYAGNDQYTHHYYIYLAGGDVALSIADPEGKNEVVITGSQLTTEYEYKLLRPVMQYNKSVESLSRKVYEAQQNQASDTTSINALNKELNETIVKCFQVPQDYIKANPSSPVSLEALRMLGTGEPGSPVTFAQIESIFNSLSTDIKESAAGKEYAEKLSQLKSKS